MFSPHEQRKIKAAKARKKKLENLERQKCLKKNYMNGEIMKIFEFLWEFWQNGIKFLRKDLVLYMGMVKSLI